MNNTLRAAATAFALSTALIIGACAQSGKSESTGAYVDDSAITTKVKSAILGEPGLKSMQISVETYQNTVQLSGFVDNALAKSRAGAVAAGVAGVKSVRNDLVVK